MRNTIEVKPEARNQKTEGNPKSEIQKYKTARSALVWSFGFLISSIAGCGETHPAPQPPPPPPELVSASQALANHQFESTISYSRSFLQNQPNGPLAAQALYFEGRGLEGKTPANPSERARNLVDARGCYLLALQQSPAHMLEADIHTSLANVDFFQDNYADCIQEASVATALTSSNDVKGYLLFRTGVSEQRLGRFTDADQTFRQVQQRYPGTHIAQAAKEDEGQTKFYVQLATYATQDAADRASASLQSRSIVVSQRTNSQGHTIIDVGSFDTFPQAKQMLDKLQSEFPDAMIVP